MPMLTFMGLSSHQRDITEASFTNQSSNVLIPLPFKLSSIWIIISMKKRLSLWHWSSLMLIPLSVTWSNYEQFSIYTSLHVVCQSAMDLLFVRVFQIFLLKMQHWDLRFRLILVTSPPGYGYVQMIVLRQPLPNYRLFCGLLALGQIYQ